MQELTLHMKRYKKLSTTLSLIKSIIINTFTGVYILIAMIFITLDMQGTYTLIGLGMLILLAIKKTYLRAL